MSQRTWIIAGLITFLLAAGGGGYGLWTNQNAHRTEVEKLKAELSAAQAVGAKSQAEAAAEAARLAEDRARIQQLEQEKESVLKARSSLEEEMRKALESKDVTISQLQGKLTVNILDRILFDSGEAELKPTGAEVLKKVAEILTQHANVKIHVIGHTDDVPIRASARKRFPSNWELSTARATAAVRFLSEQAGIDPKRLGAVGYGEYRPIADNTTPEGRAKNRRIAITILSEEMAGSDAVPTVSTNAPAVVTPPAATPVVTPGIPATNSTPEAMAPSTTNPPAAAEPK